MTLIPAATTLRGRAPSPLAYRCPLCKAMPGEPCVSRSSHKVEHSHQCRQDVMIHAQWSPPSLAVWLGWQTERQDPVGDLARDVAEDVRQGCLSARVRAGSGLRRHLQQHHDTDVMSRVFDALDRAESEHAQALAAEVTR